MTAMVANRTPSRDIASFLTSLFTGKAEDRYILLWTLAEKDSHWFRDIKEAIRFAELRRGQDLYVGVGLSDRDYGPANRCVSTEVAGLIGLWADFDFKSDAHSKVALPTTVGEVLELLPKEFPPTFIILTGNGVHAWWLFREPLAFETDEERSQAASLVQRWQTLLRFNAAARGWAFDRLSDLARVLRVPGTQNCKDTGNPKPVSIHTQTDHRYNPSDFAEFLEDHGVPDAEEQDRVNQDWKTKFADKHLSIDPSSAIADDLLNQYMAADSRFRSTWLRQREDLKDQSQSGYDLALANFGFEQGLSEQQVVELIIHHRRIHSQRFRTRLDYFQRTIAKAFRRNEDNTPGNSFDVPAQEAGQTATQRPDVSDHLKA